jgi:hypothetical protein
MPLLSHKSLCFIIGCACVLNPASLARPQQARQTPEVIEVYRVCKRFEQLLCANLDFAVAYDATFTKDMGRRRAIAIADGEIGGQDSAHIDDQLLIRGYKLRMQIFYFTLLLANPSDEEEPLFFPPPIKAILERKEPADSRDFGSYVAQLERDVACFRVHLAGLVANNAAVAERVVNFKSSILSARFEPPIDHKIEPRRGGYHRSGVLGRDEAYYEVNGCTVVRERGQVRLIGIRFFNRLF